MKVNGKDDIPYIWKHNPNVPNQQPAKNGEFNRKMMMIHENFGYCSHKSTGVYPYNFCGLNGAKSKIGI
jgi:hypothetical protein